MIDYTKALKSLSLDTAIPEDWGGSVTAEQAAKFMDMTTSRVRHILKEAREAGSIRARRGRKTNEFLYSTKDVYEFFKKKLES